MDAVENRQQWSYRTTAARHTPARFQGAGRVGCLTSCLYWTKCFAMRLI